HYYEYLIKYVDFSDNDQYAMLLHTRLGYACYKCKDMEGTRQAWTKGFRLMMALPMQQWDTDMLHDLVTFLQTHGGISPDKLPEAH
ncbi:MAG: hypothetical protein AAF840_06440, partial [Bacteroidota bacterium]